MSRSRTWKSIGWLPALVVLVGLACTAIAGSTPTQPVPPSQVPLPTETLQPTQAPEPTRTAAPEPSEAAASPTVESISAPIEFDSELYTHPSGIFEAYSPAGWSLDQDDGSTLYEAPDGSGAIYVQVTNTGYALDTQALENFILAREANFFGPYEAYTILDQQIDLDNGAATMTKSLLFDGIPQIVTTNYSQYDQAIYSIDFWADREVFEEYAEHYDRFFSDVTVYPGAAIDQEKYLWIYTFEGPGALFSIEVPTAWTYELTSGDFTVVDTFYSPDDHAVIQNVAYDDGEQISKSDAGAFALELLRSFYAEDIRITDDQVQEDGSERLTWNSPNGAYSGVSFFESRGTTFLLFTVMYDDPFVDVYYDILDYTISTYTTP